jgi:lipopolysaccharide export system permease protein
MKVLPQLRPRILEAYIGREYGKLMLLSLAAFVGVFLVVDFFEKIDRLVKAGLGPGELGAYLLLKLPFALEQVLPAAVMLATLLAFGLLSRGHETMAMRTSGLDIVRLTRPIWWRAGVAVGLLAALGLYLVPWSQARLQQFWEVKVQKKPARSLISLEHLWYKGDRAIYNVLVFQKPLQTLEGVTVYLFDEQFRLTAVVTARKAVWEGDRWRFHEGAVQVLDPTMPGAHEEFVDRSFDLTEKPEDFYALEKKMSEMDVGELSNYVARLERDGYKSTPYRAELHSRFSLALAPLLLAALGLGLALSLEGLYLPALVTAGMGCMFLYWLIFGLGVSFGQAGRLPLFVAVWLPHLLFGGLSAFLLSRAIR